MIKGNVSVGQMYGTWVVCKQNSIVKKSLLQVNKREERRLYRTTAVFDSASNVMLERKKDIRDKESGKSVSSC